MFIKGGKVGKEGEKEVHHGSTRKECSRGVGGKGRVLCAGEVGETEDRMQRVTWCAENVRCQEGCLPLETGNLQVLDETWSAREECRERVLSAGSIAEC